MSASREAAAQPQSPEPSRKSSAQKRILVVEDNLDAVHSLVMLLRDMGHRVEYAINGYAALEAARKMKPEIVFLDLGLPGMDGFELCRRLKKDHELSSVHVISVTAYGTDDYRTRAKAAGCAHYLVKPVSTQQLADAIAGAAI